jgi:hypothetical protein
MFITLLIPLNEYSRCRVLTGVADEGFELDRVDVALDKPLCKG